MRGVWGLKITMVVLGLLSSGILFAASGHGEVHWSYRGETGPAHWGDLKSEFSTCKSGKQQSPINIRAAHSAALAAITPAYQAVPLYVLNNGHTIQVNVASGSHVTVAGKQYELLQFHFHSPSEHEVDGRAADMVAHLVHKAADGQLGVIAVLMKKGDNNPLIEKIWKHLPSHEGEYSKAAIHINAADLLPEELSYYHYAGSLTTPPCSEGVNWMVLKKEVEVSAAQVKVFTDIFQKSTRPVQPLNGRSVELSR